MAGKTIQDLPNDSGLNDGDLIEGQNTASGSYKTTLGKIKTYVTTTIQNLLNNKVDKVPGKQLSTEDYTSAEKSKLAGIQDQAQKNVINSIELNGQVQNPDSTGKVSLNVQSGGGAGDATQAGNNTFTGQNEYTQPLTIVDAASGKHAVTKDQLDTKVDKSGSKQLSDENYTNAEKQKLAGLDDSLYAKLSQPNIFTGDNVFNQPVTVTGALQDDHAINKGQVDTITGQLSSLTTNAKTSLVDAINEVKNAQTTGGYTLPVATDSVLGGVKAGTSDGEVNVAGDGKMSVQGWSTLNNKFNDYTTTTAMNLLLDSKVDKVPGKELSENNFTSAYKAQLDGLQTELDNKVNVDGSKVLSDENFTTALKNKLDGLNSSEYVKVNGGNIIADDNEFTSSLKVATATLGEHAVRKEQVDNVTGVLSNLQTGDKSNLVNAINEVANSLVTGGYVLPQASDSALGGIKTGQGDENIVVDGGGVASLKGYSALLNKFNDYTDTSALNALLANKVNTEAGKGLSEEDFTSALKSKLDALDDSLYAKIGSANTFSEVNTFTQPPKVPAAVSGGDAVNKDYVDTELSGKVDKSGNKQLSDENFSSADKLKLDSIDDSLYVKKDGGNTINDTNVFTQPLSVGAAAGNTDAMQKQQVEEITGDKGQLITTAKNNLVEAINEVKTAQTTGGYVLPTASNTTLGGIKTGMDKGDVQVDGGGKASVVGFDTKVDKDGSKVLSENDFTNTYKSKLDDLDSNLAAKADDLAVVKVTGDQSVDGKKTFNDYTLSKGIQVNTNIGTNLGSSNNLGAFDVSHVNGFYSLSNTGTRTAMIGRDSSTGDKLRLYNEITDSSMPNNRSPILVNCAIEFPSAYAPTNDLHAVNKAYVDNEVANLEQAISALQGGLTIIGQIGSSKDDVTGNPDLLTQFVQTTVSRPPRNGDMVRTSDSYAFVYNGSSWVNSGITGSGPASITDLGLIKLGTADGQLGDDNGIAKVNGWDALNLKVDGKANDSDVLKLTGNQSASGNKTFSDSVFLGNKLDFNYPSSGLDFVTRYQLDNATNHVNIIRVHKAGVRWDLRVVLASGNFSWVELAGETYIPNCKDPSADSNAANKRYVDKKFKVVATVPTTSDLAEGCMAVQV